MSYEKDELSQQCQHLLVVDCICKVCGEFTGPKRPLADTGPRVRLYSVVRRAVDQAVDQGYHYGIRRWDKHRDVGTPPLMSSAEFSEHMIQKIADLVMDELLEIFTFPDENA